MSIFLGVIQILIQLLLPAIAGYSYRSLQETRERQKKAEEELEKSMEDRQWAARMSDLRKTVKEAMREQQLRN